MPFYLAFCWTFSAAECKARRICCSCLCR